MKKNTLLSLLILLGTTSVILGQNTTITYPAGSFATFLDGELEGAEWSIVQCGL